MSDAEPLSESSSSSSSESSVEEEEVEEGEAPEVGPMPSSGEQAPRPRTQRITQPLLTKFERARILGERVRQLRRGAHLTIEHDRLCTLLQLAERELVLGTIPIMIRRHLEDGTYETWAVRELFR